MGVSRGGVRSMFLNARITTQLNEVSNIARSSGDGPPIESLLWKSLTDINLVGPFSNKIRDLAEPRTAVTAAAAAVVGQCAKLVMFRLIYQTRGRAGGDNA